MHVSAYSSVRSCRGAGAKSISSSMERYNSESLSREEREENSAAQRDELEALEAIYGDDFQRIIPRTVQSSAAPCTEIRLRVSETPLVSLHLRLPEDYPSRAFPRHEILAPGLDQATRSELRRALCTGGGGSVLESMQDPNALGERLDENMSAPGTVVVFDWAETLRELLSHKFQGTACTSGVNGDGATGSSAKTVVTGGNSSWPADGDQKECSNEYDQFSRSQTTAMEDAEDSVEIIHGEPFTDRKSTFQAHLAKVSSEYEVVWVRHRLMQNSKIARATHNVAAWRIWDDSKGVQLHDNDDDGESAAGSRLAHMLAITGAQNVLVVVSRWYGGIHLGPDRFKHINNAARELLVQYGVTAGGESVDRKTGRNPSAAVGGGKPKGRRRRGSGSGGN